MSIVAVLAGSALRIVESSDDMLACVFSRILEDVAVITSANKTEQRRAQLSGRPIYHSVRKLVRARLGPKQGKGEAESFNTLPFAA